MPITINGDGTITGISAGGLPDNSVTLADMAGGTDGQIITYDASGDPVAVGPGSDGQVLTSTGAGSPPAFEAVPTGVIKKIHTFEFATRTAANASDNTNQFTFTTAFTPLDAVNNSFLVHYTVPCETSQQNYHGFGLRFEDTTGGGNVEDFQCKGIGYATAWSANYHGTTWQSFYIGANVINQATQTIYYRITEGASVHSGFIFCLNTSDDSRISTQSAAHLIITEYKN